MCYTTDEYAKPRTEVKYNATFPYGTDGYRTNCNNIKVSWLIALNGVIELPIEKLAKVLENSSEFQGQFWIKCGANHLLINADKTKLVLFGTRQLVSKLPDVTVSFLGQKLCPVSSAKDLGVTLDSGLTFNNHISSLSSSSLSSLCQISRVRHLFSKEVLYIMINSVVCSKLCYCSAVWAVTYKQNIHKLKLMQNFAARILTDTGKYDHITPALKALGWLTIEEQLWLREVTMMYKCVNNLVPTYISCKIGKRSNAHAYNLRNSEDLNLPGCRTAAAQSGFFYRATKAWNSVSNNTRTARLLRSFKKR